MVKVKFTYSKQAKKFFSKHEEIRNKFEESIHSLYLGKKVDIKKIQGLKELTYRIRINSYRVIFSIIDGQIVVINTILAGNRGDIYKHLKS